MKLKAVYWVLLKLMVLAFVVLLNPNIAISQPTLPQRTITVTATQPIHFGSFCITGGGGGTVTVNYDGSRTTTGNILLLSMTPIAQPAIFDIKLCHGRNVIITYDATTTLSDGVETLTMDIGPTEKGVSGVSFLTNNDCNFITSMRVGGTLHIPGTASPGAYTGSFSITFNQE